MHTFPVLLSVDCKVSDVIRELTTFNHSESVLQFIFDALFTQRFTPDYLALVKKPPLKPIVSGKRKNKQLESEIISQKFNAFFVLRQQIKPDTIVSLEPLIEQIGIKLFD